MTTRSQSFKEEYTTFGKKQIKAEILEEEEEKMSPAIGLNNSNSKAKKVKKPMGVEIKNKDKFLLTKEPSIDRENDYVLQAHSSKTEILDEKEIRIYQWLDTKKIYMADPKELIYSHFEKTRENIFKGKYSQENSDSPSKKVDLDRSGLLIRRKLTNGNGECLSASPELMKFCVKRNSCEPKLVTGLGKSEFNKWASKTNTLIENQESEKKSEDKDNNLME